MVRSQNSNDSIFDHREHSTKSNDSLDKVRATLSDPKGNDILSGRRTLDSESSLPNIQFISTTSGTLEQTLKPKDTERSSASKNAVDALSSLLNLQHPNLLPHLELVQAQTEPETPPNIEELKQQLGASDFQAREDAQQQLEKMGLKAIPILTEIGKTTDDPEIRRRAGLAIENIDSAASAKFLQKPFSEASKNFTDFAPEQIEEMKFQVPNFADLTRLKGIDQQTAKSDARQIEQMVKDLGGLQGMKGRPDMQNRIAQLTNLKSDYDKLDERKKSIDAIAGKVKDLEVTSDTTPDQLKFLSLAPNLEHLTAVNVKGANKVLEHVKESGKLGRLGLGGSDVTDEGLRNIEGSKFEKSLTLLSLAGTKITDDGLKSLSGLTSLEGLTLSRTNVSDRGIEQLAGLTKLHDLALNSTKLTDEGVSKLAKLKDLNRLELQETKISGSGFEALADLKKLNYLRLDGSTVQDAQTKHIFKLSGLENLNLSNTSVSDEGLKGIKGLNKLHYLGLRNTNVGNEGLEHLKGLDHLSTLILSGNRNISDGAIDKLIDMKNLKTVDLSGTNISPQGLARLQRERRDLSITPEPPAPPKIPIIIQ